MVLVLNSIGVEKVLGVGVGIGVVWVLASYRSIGIKNSCSFSECILL